MITEILKLIAPGTPIRDGLENILKAKTGALIVISDTKEVLDLVDGGFRLDIDYTSSRLYELAKMDGAIVLSADLKRILYANTRQAFLSGKGFVDKITKRSNSFNLFNVEWIY